MWHFLARNRPAAAMLVVLTAAALVVIFLATKGASYKEIEKLPEEINDVSEDPNIFSTFT